MNRKICLSIPSNVSCSFFRNVRFNWFW